MPSGSTPTYTYQPANPGTEPHLRTRSTRRARLFDGGTYFRAREPGGQGNNISVELLEWTTNNVKTGKLVVTNHNTSNDNVIGPADVIFIEQTLDWREFITIDNLTTKPRAQINSISSQIAEVGTPEDLGEFTFSQLFYVPNKLSVQLSPRTSEFTPTSKIIIKARTRVYDLVQITVTPTTESGTPGTPQTGWDPAALRTAVNANDPWIEMMERSGEPAAVGGVPGVAPDPKFDYQDDGVDDMFLTPFDDTFLGDGDGLPPYPIGNTGPSRSIVHINYGEAPNGKLTEVNEVYEWVGESSNVGEWKRY